MTKKNRFSEFLICINNDDYPVSLEMRNIYRAVPDSDAEKLGFVRVVDESGEDYLYPERFFVPVKLPKGAEQAFSEAS